MARQRSSAGVGDGEVLRIRLLGGLEVEGLAPVEIGSRKARTALRLLALRNGRPVAVDQLADAVWPERGADHSANQLAVLVSRLRRVLGRQRITFGDGAYSLQATWTDLEAVLAVDGALDGAPSGRRDGATVGLDEVLAALALVRGPLLPEADDAPWVDQERRALERAVARLRHAGAEMALAVGASDTAAELSEAALGADPFDEAALRSLMVAELRRGRAGAGLAAYARVREVLREELGASPSADTEAVHAALVADDPPPAVADPPAETGPAPIVGRQSELARLADEVTRARLGRGRLTVVEGEPGIGKSTLVAELGRRVRAREEIWLEGRCDPVLSAVPWQPVIDALAGHLRALPPVDAATLLAGEQAVLGPLVGGIAVGGGDAWLDEAPGPLRALAAFGAVFTRLTSAQPAVLAIEDVHRATPSTVELVGWLQHRCPRLAIVATRRPGQGPSLGSHQTIRLGPLSRDEVCRLVGRDRAAELSVRSGGNPLFLTQLASDPGPALPGTLVELVRHTAEELGPAGDTLQVAAVLGDPIDVDLLAALQALSPRQVTEQLELAARRLLLVVEEGRYRFRHEVVRDALAEATSDALARRIHRDAASVLASRPGTDPLTVAHHARAAGEPGLAADALASAADLAALRFERGGAEQLLDEAIELSDRPDRRVARARLRTMRGCFQGALDDVAVATARGAGAVALEAGAWAAYFARRFDESRAFADDGAVLADEPAVQASCLTVAARVRHATGDLPGAERLLVRAISLTQGSARVTSDVWLGVLRAHQSRIDEAVARLRPITRFEAGGQRTTELLHALLFLGHALALGGRPLEALDVLGRYDEEVARRDVPRFAGRGANFCGWIRRALGQWDRADDENRRALDELGSVDFPETRVAAHLDLASSALLRGDPDRAAAALAVADAALGDHLTFGWRLRWRRDLVAARVALAAGDPEAAMALAEPVVDGSRRLEVPRYATEAELVVLRGRARSGHEVTPDELGARLGAGLGSLGPDAWWVLTEAARELAPCRDAAASAAGQLARQAGDQSSELPAAMARLLG